MSTVLKQIKAEAVVDALRGFEVGDTVTIHHSRVYPKGCLGTILWRNASGHFVVQIARERTVHGLVDEDLRHAN